MRVHERVYEAGLRGLKGKVARPSDPLLASAARLSPAARLVFPVRASLFTTAVLYKRTRRLFVKGLL